jgi:hypothetical protein
MTTVLQWFTVRVILGLRFEMKKSAYIRLKEMQIKTTKSCNETRLKKIFKERIKVWLKKNKSVF